MPIASSSLDSLSKQLWGKILSTNSSDLDALSDSIDQTTKTTGIPQLALLPMALKSPKVLSKLSQIVKTNLKSPIPLIRYQREPTLGASHPGRGALFFSPNMWSTMYKDTVSSLPIEGGSNLIKTTLQPKNPLLVEQGFSGLTSALKRLLGQNPQEWAREYRKLPNNVQRQIMSHNANRAFSGHSLNSNYLTDVMKERLASEMLKKQGYDSVLSYLPQSVDEKLSEVIQLRNTRGTHKKP